MSVSEWADKNRILTPEESARPGPWDTSRTPYLRAIMDAFSDDEIQTITFLKPTQVGGTECAINAVGYVIDQDPSRMLYVLPDADMAAEFSSKRLQMFLGNCECFDGKYFEGDSKDLLLDFRGGFVKLAGAQSPGKLAMWPVRRIIEDEIDKYPMTSGKEASPLKLAEERTKNYVHNKKIFLLSTPTLKTGHIYKSYEEADARYKYHVPCPHCGFLQTFVFKNIKYDKTQHVTLIQENAHYECCHCHQAIYDKDKPEMLAKGKWLSNDHAEGKARKVAFSLNSIYSPWLSFGDVAAEFVRSKDDTKSLMNFVNSWLGEPWENKAGSLERDKVLERQCEYEETEIPESAMLLTGGVDVQEIGFYFVIRAWGPRMTSWNVAHGYLDYWEDVESIMNRTFRDRNGEEYLVNLCAIDSGHKTEDVYEFCLSRSWSAPVKGSSLQMLQRYKQSFIDKPDSKAHGQKLYIVDTDQYKDMIAARMSKPNGLGSWMVFKNCDEEYAEQITSEHKIITKKGNREVETWVPKTSAARNHYLDCEVYAACAADIMGVRYLEERAEEIRAAVKTASSSSEEKPWIEEREDWLK